MPPSTSYRSVYNRTSRRSRTRPEVHLSPSADGFQQQFEALTDRVPFPWQTALFERFASGDVPSQCNIPTGLGKTSVLPIWLLALARCAEHGEAASFPRRLVYVVNRRTVGTPRLRGSPPGSFRASSMRGATASPGTWPASRGSMSASIGATVQASPRASPAPSALAAVDSLGSGSSQRNELARSVNAASLSAAAVGRVRA